MKGLLELLKDAQNGSSEAKEELYKKFLPYIRYYGKRMYYEEAQTDLTIFLLEFINKINLVKFEKRNEGEIKNYIKDFFISRFMDFGRKNINKNIEITAFETDFICNDCYEELERENFYRMLKNLKSIQKKIIIGKYVYNYTDIELAKIFHVSRQTIFNQKKKALQQLKKEREDELHGRKTV